MDDLIALLNDALAAPGTVLLDGAGGRPGSQSLLFRDPHRQIIARTGAEVRRALEAVESAAAQGHAVAGFICYEAGHAEWESRFSELRTDQALPGGLPLVWFGVYEHATSVPAQVLERWAAEGDHALIPDLHPQESKQEFTTRVVQIRDLIREGDVYQVNHTTRLRGQYTDTAEALFRTVRERQPVGFGSFIRLEQAAILSFSPELFFQQRGTRIETEPMKGTAPRGGTPEQDRHLQHWLALDEKNRAENLMIVDLLRNDLSMVSKAGSVRVPEQFVVQALPSVHQMTSRIEAELVEGADFPALVEALFPCGSITGAPKLRAMRRIAELEAGPRGVYCGAIGFVEGVGAERRSVFSVAIRTAVLEGRDLTLGAGGGIVWDSDPDEEYREMLLKTRFFSSSPDHEDIQLIETMRVDAARGIPWLTWHLDRLSASAASLGFHFEDTYVRQAIDDALEGIGTEGGRLRLLLSHKGEVSISFRELEMMPAGSLQICISPVRIASSHPRYRHKTTDRGPYNQAAQFAVEQSCYDALLINERGEVTEGARTNVFIRRGDHWYTPPLESGLLAGVGRRAFMLEHAVSENVLTPDDLGAADEIRVTNAIIGERVAHLIDQD